MFRSSRSLLVALQRVKECSSLRSGTRQMSLEAQEQESKSNRNHFISFQFNCFILQFSFLSKIMAVLESLKNTKKDQMKDEPCI